MIKKESRGVSMNRDEYQIKQVVAMRLPPEVITRLIILSEQKRVPYTTFIRRLVMRELGFKILGLELWENEVNTSRMLYAINNQ